jgi:phosphatidylserine/phosphatidylglycerophosphate/cardiolipin synthase-like enzyme
MINKKISFLGLLVSSLLFSACLIEDPLLPPAPTPTPTATVSSSPKPTPTATPKPTVTPTISPTVSPSVSPSPSSGTLDWAEVFFSKPNDGTLEDLPEDNIDQMLVEKLKLAKKTIDIAVYEIDNQIITDALIEAKKRGVVVRLVTDTDYMGETSITSLKAANVPIVDDNRSAIMHNKFIIIDSEYIWTGSFNATENDANKNNNNSMIIKSKELSENYTYEFNEMFNDKKFGPTSPDYIPYPLVTMSDGTELISKFSPENDPDQLIVDEVKKAKKSIYFMAFSFTHDEIGDAMIERFKSGVEVKGLFEKTGATTTYSEYPKMKDAGISVKLDSNSKNMHNKVIIVDGKVTMLGSFNFSANATSSNDENLLTVRNNTTIAKTYTDEFNKLFATGVN